MVIMYSTTIVICHKRKRASASECPSFLVFLKISCLAIRNKIQVRDSNSKFNTTTTIPSLLSVAPAPAKMSSSNILAAACEKVRALLPLSEEEMRALCVAALAVCEEKEKVSLSYLSSFILCIT